MKSERLELEWGDGAEISDDGLYRYNLTRRWADGPTATWIMLNPSTADEEQDDPTIRRCIGFSKREGCGALIVVNLFAFRATDPQDLFESRTAGIDIAGELNDEYVADALRSADLRIAAWGSHGPATLWPQTWSPLQCLGATRHGQPRHPLYVRGDQPLVPFGKQAA